MVMAAVGKYKRFYMEKLVDGKRFYWQIRVKGTTTVLKVGETRGPAVDLETIDHGSVFKAKKFAEKQTNIMLKKGYKYKSGKLKIHPNDDDIDMASVPDSMEEDNLSVASSTSTLDMQESSLETAGISPLNRRKFDKNDPFDPPIFMRPNLQTDVTMVSAIPGSWSEWRKTNSVKRSLERDDTLIDVMSEKRRRTKPDEAELTKVSTKWGKWRSEQSLGAVEQQTSGSRLRRKRTLNEDDATASFTLLKKKSTTRDLRQHLGGINMHSQPVAVTSRPLTRLQRKLSGTSLEQFSTLTKKQSTTCDLRQQLSSTKFTRKPSRVAPLTTKQKDASLHTIEEEETGSLDETDWNVPVEREKTEADAPAASTDHHQRQMMKRTKSKAFSGQDSLLQPRSKRARRGSQLLTVQQKCPLKMFMPQEESWPVLMKEQLLFTCSLDDLIPGCKQCSAVFAEDGRWYIGTSTGAVIELNSSGSVLKIIDLPCEVLSMNTDGGQVYVGCSNASVYDISKNKPRLISSNSDLGKIQDAEILRHQIAFCDDLGHVTLINIHGSPVWKVKSQNQLGHLVKVDESGVYHGHSDGVTKYSLVDGCVIWDFSSSTGVHRGALSHSTLYVCCGNKVLKIDKMTGQVEKELCKDDSSEDVVQCLAVGGAAVFAGDHKNLIVYDEKSGKVAYCMSPQHQSYAMQYESGQLLSARDGGFAILDLSQGTLEEAMKGRNLKPTAITGDSDIVHVAPSSDAAETTGSAARKKSKPRGGKLRAKGATAK